MPKVSFVSITNLKFNFTDLANEHHHSTPIPEEAERKKREEGPPHPTPRERRQVPPNEPITPHTPTPSRRKRNTETTTTMVHPVLEEADAMAEGIDESESAGVKKRENGESSNSNDEEEEETTETAVVEKREDEEDDTEAEPLKDDVKEHGMFLNEMRK